VSKGALERNLVRRRARGYGSAFSSMSRRDLTMKDTPWILVDTETTGIRPPIFVVEIGAQRMRGWEPEGPPFQRLLNQNRDIPPEVARVHGYTKEILERDGEPAEAVYEAFADYVGDLPLVSYNLQYDLDQVLLPEWRRLGIDQVGIRGFCALRLTQRLLDPVPAGNCKLQTLRQYYRLPQRGAHTALGDVETVVDLLGQVLRPLAEQRGLDSWQSVCGFTIQDWYPTRIAFGKFKDRLFWDAETDSALHNWLVGLSQSTNRRNAAIGRWYLSQLAEGKRPDMVLRPAEVSASNGDAGDAPSTALVIYTDPAIEEVKQLIAAARTRLAEVEAAYMTARARTEFVTSRLYTRLRDRYRRRDRLARLVEYRRRYMETLLQDGEEEAESVADAHGAAQASMDADYDALDRDADSRVEPTPEQEQEIKALWLKLVKTYHPDQYANEPEKQERYNQLMQAINQAKDKGEVAILHEIADDPEGFVQRQGWGTLALDDDDDLDRLRHLYEGLQSQIITLLDRLNDLQESLAFDIYRRVEAEPDLLDEIAARQGALLDTEIATLETEAQQLATEIEELTGQPSRVSL